jgi:hypothetical protein
MCREPRRIRAGKIGFRLPLSGTNLEIAVRAFKSGENYDSRLIERISRLSFDSRFTSPNYAVSACARLTPLGVPQPEAAS